MTTEEAIDTLVTGIRHNPIALISCCTLQLVQIRKYHPDLLPSALGVFAAITTAIADRHGETKSGTVADAARKSLE
jgi:hypothetical protein